MSLRLCVVDARNHKDATALGRFVAAKAPHVVCVQHAPRWLRWRSKCGRLARLSGLVVVAGGRTADGNLILSSLGVDIVQTWESKLGAIARMRLSGVELAVAATSLDADELATSSALQVALTPVGPVPAVRTGRSKAILADAGLDVTVL